MNFLYYENIIPTRRTRMIYFNIEVLINLSHSDRGRSSVWSWREAKLCFTRTRKHTEASQRRPSEASPLWTLSVEWLKWQLTIQRRNMSSDWSEYPGLWRNISILSPLFLSSGYKTEEIICSKLWMTSRWISG